MIRDSALWRLIDSVQGIHKEIKAEAANVDPWPTVGFEEGVLALAEAIGCPTEEPSPSQAVGSTMGAEDLCDAAAVVMGRLEKLVGLSRDIKGYFDGAFPSGAEGISTTMDAVASMVADVNEELLCVLDDPSASSLREWLRQWSGIIDADRGQRLETTMAALPLKRDAELTTEARRVRRRWLALLRGVQVLLNQDAIRAWAVTSLGEAEPGSPSSWKPPSEASASMGMGQEGDDDDLSLTTPPSPRVVLLAPPGGGLPYRPPERQSLPGGEVPVDQGTASVPMATQPGLRPETPSTTCEDAMASGSRPGTPGKFIDGQYVAGRPNSANKRLPPIGHPPSSLSRPAALR
jgi:hypothetical protein